MTYMGRIGTGDLDAITITTGVVIPYKQSDKGVTLVVGTYYFSLGAPDAILNSQALVSSAHVQWAAAVAATITLETSNFPATIGGLPTGQGVADVTDYSATAGDWIPENPSTAIVGVVGSGNSATAATVTAGGSAAGGCSFHLGNLGTRRARIKVVTTVGGIVRVNIHGKGGSTS